MKRQHNLQISSSGEFSRAASVQMLLEQEDQIPASIRNTLCDMYCKMAQYECYVNTAALVLTPNTFIIRVLTNYHTYFQVIQQSKQISTNCALISLKHYLSFTLHQHILHDDPSVPMKLVGRKDRIFRNLDDKDGPALIAAVTKEGLLRGSVLIILLLYTRLQGIK